MKIWINKSRPVLSTIVFRTSLIVSCCVQGGLAFTEIETTAKRGGSRSRLVGKSVSIKLLKSVIIKL